MRTIQLISESQYRRLDACLAENTSLTRSHIQKVMADGGVTVNGKVVTKPSTSVKEDAQIVVTLPDEIPLDIPAQNIPLDIVYQDEYLAVINKSQGMTVHPANNVYTNTLVNALLYHVTDLSGINGVLRPGIVHRLDKDTSGLLVVAKKDVAHVELQKQIQTKTCKRIYLALLEGVLKQDEGIVDAPIGRCPTDRKKMDVVADGRSAQTHYKVVERFKTHTLVQFELKTGRTHQIRVHASKCLHHPVVGDKTYGYKTQKFALDGQLLHSKHLSFVHPHTGEELTFSAPLPDYFNKVLDVLHNKEGLA